MGAHTRALSRTLLLAVFGVWGWVLVRIGLWRLVAGPHARDADTRLDRALGAALAAAGVFVFAWAASRCFPRASPKVTITAEVAPWVGLAAFLLGGWA